jgi:hypothetical protein
LSSLPTSRSRVWNWESASTWGMYECVRADGLCNAAVAYWPASAAVALRVDVACLCVSTVQTRPCCHVGLLGCWPCRLGHVGCGRGLGLARGVGCDLSDICLDRCRIHPIKVMDIRYPTDISHIIFRSDIRTDYTYPFFEKIRISENSIRTSVHHLRTRIRTDIFRTILYPYKNSSTVKI